MNKNTWIVAIVCIIVAGGAGFFGGMKYQASKTPAVASRTGAAGAAGFAGRTRTGGAAGGAGFLNGSVLTINGTTMTVKLMNGGSQVVVLAPSTSYRKAVDGTASDLTVGSNVTVTGSSNSDGSLTAQSVQIRQSTSTSPSMAPMMPVGQNPQ